MNIENILIVIGIMIFNVMLFVIIGMMANLHATLSNLYELMRYKIDTDK